MNLHDECAFNKTVDGNQLIVQFHADDLKASCKDHRELSNLMSELRLVFRKGDEL